MIDVKQSLAHTTWNCKYHIVFAPKYRRKVFYKEKRAEVGKILRTLCEWKKVKITSFLTSILSLETLPPRSLLDVQTSSPSQSKLSLIPKDLLSGQRVRQPGFLGNAKNRNASKANSSCAGCPIAEACSSKNKNKCPNDRTKTEKTRSKFV